MRQTFSGPKYLALNHFLKKKLSSGVLYKPSLKVLLEITIDKVIRRVKKDSLPLESAKRLTEINCDVHGDFFPGLLR